MIEAGTSSDVITVREIDNLDVTSQSADVFGWKAFSAEIAGSAARSGFTLRFVATTNAARNTNFLFDTLELVPASCP